MSTYRINHMQTGNRHTAIRAHVFNWLTCLSAAEINAFSRGRDVTTMATECRSEGWCIAALTDSTTGKNEDITVEEVAEALSYIRSKVVGGNIADEVSR